jgi:hypothetical protein
VLVGINAFRSAFNVRRIVDFIAILTLILPSEKTEDALCNVSHVKKIVARREKMIEKGRILTGNDARLANACAFRSQDKNL